MTFLEALEENKSRRVRISTDNQEKYLWWDVMQLRTSLSTFDITDYEAHWEAEELPQILEFECVWEKWSGYGPIYPIGERERGCDFKKLIGKRWRVRCEEIR